MRESNDFLHYFFKIIKFIKKNLFLIGRDLRIKAGWLLTNLLSRKRKVMLVGGVLPP